MGRRAGMDRTWTWRPGNDSGSALLIAVVMILVLSLLYLSTAPYIITMERNADRYRERILDRIHEHNRALAADYELP
jgi:Tfp pilus assembly protein PilX